MHKKIEVQVLLATLNGEKFIVQFLDSLVSQQKVKINLLVSDDGSSDNTISIIRSYEKSFNSLRILKGPKQGVAANFIFLSNNANGKYFAFADQDDVWFDDKLITAIQLLRGCDLPAIYIGTMNYLGRRGKSKRPFKAPLSIMKNRSHGCSMVFNYNLLKIIKKIEPSNIIMHDWAALLTAQAFGRVYFDKVPKMHYRLHLDNSIGIPSNYLRIKNYVRNISKIGSRSCIKSQLDEILSLNSYSSLSKESEIFIEWTLNVDRNFWFRLMYVTINLNSFIKNSAGFFATMQFIFGSFNSTQGMLMNPSKDL